MELSIAIEIDDRAPDIELCGTNCKYLKNGLCELFGKQLDEYSHNKIDDFDGKNIVYEETSAFYTWKRYEPCIKLFYSPWILKHMIKDNFDLLPDKETPVLV
jgi:hypothetical protein